MNPLMPDKREATVAGQFYPSDPEELEQVVSENLGDGPTRDALGVMSPHAGYQYSGAVAGAVYAAVKMPRRFVVIGPNHTGIGSVASIVKSGAWELPGGEVNVDKSLAEAIIDGSKVIVIDRSAHVYEHSIEVQLPFLMHLAADLTFVPISIMNISEDVCRDIGHAVATAVRDAGEPVLIVASSDMTHYESSNEARRKDELALGRMLSLDPVGLIDTVYGNGISMCGVAPAAAMLFACLELGASGAELISYANSGDATGDYRQVVGYAGVLVY